uniref:Alpha-1,2-mannosyltransferase n=1 Tax=Candidozyma auris TaxID=498019 RepID=A0A0L0NQQ2_CANAR
MKHLLTKKLVIVKIALVAFVLVFLAHQLTYLPYNPYDFFQNGRKGIIPIKAFFDGLEKYAVHGDRLKGNYINEKVHDAPSKDREFLYSKEYLEGILNIKDETFQKLKESHHGFVNEHMPHLLDTVGVATFGELTPKSDKWESYRNSAGYVLIGGGKYSWLAYLVVKQIRMTGSTLPVEVFIPTKSDLDARFCNEIMPKYNARCNMLDLSLLEYLSLKFNLSGYQYKMLAIMASLFENVIYLDSDLYPLKNVEYLLTSDLYKEKGLLIWPDYWSRTTNPKYYEIAGLHVPEKKVRYSQYDRAQAEKKGEGLRDLKDYTFKDSNFHDFENTLPNPTSEAGVMLVNKTSHVRTLLLALYYNVYGPNFYYPLLTQGGAGEGDKETFIAAATVMQEPWFQTQKQFMWVGYHSEDTSKFESKALGHYDPITAKDDDKPAPLIFSHCSYPKHWTDWMYNNNDLIYKTLGEHIRMYKGTYENIGYDLDLRLLTAFTEALCEDIWLEKEKEDNIPLDQREEYMGNFLEYINNDREVNKKRCEEVYVPHLKWLQQTTQYPDTLKPE